MLAIMLLLFVDWLEATAPLCLQWLSNLPCCFSDQILWWSLTPNTWFYPASFAIPSLTPQGRPSDSSASSICTLPLPYKSGRADARMTYSQCTRKVMLAWHARPSDKQQVSYAWERLWAFQHPWIMDSPSPPQTHTTALNLQVLERLPITSLAIHTLDHCFSPDTWSMLWGPGSLDLPGVSGLLTSHHNAVVTKFMHEKSASWEEAIKIKYFKLLRKKEKKKKPVF